MSISLQLFLEIIVLLGGLAGIYIMVITRITKLEAQVEHIENTADKAMAQLNGKLDKITEELSDVRIMLENKANRQ